MNDHQAMLAIQELLDGVEWDSTTTSAIADILIRSGYRIRDLNDVNLELAEGGETTVNVFRYLSPEPMPRIPEGTSVLLDLRTANEIVAERKAARSDEITDPCPDCGAQLKDASGGGVKCPKCPYWFCF